VALKATKFGTMSNENGIFQFKAPAGSYTLIASVIGFEAKEVPIKIKAGSTTQVPDFQLNESLNQLKEVNISAQKSQDYTEKISEIGSRSPVPLRDLPQAIQIINTQFMKDRQIQSLGEATRNLVGINAFSSQQYSDYVMRGFRTSAGNFAYNGIRGDLYQFDQAVLTYNIERIEAVRGPASVLFSAGNPGGILNLVTKKAQATPAYEVNFTLGSFNQYRAMADATGAVSANKKLLYRLIVGYENSGAMDKNLKMENIFVAPQLQYNFSENTSVNYELNYVKDDRTMSFHRGVPALLKADGSYQLDYLDARFSMIDPDGFSKRRILSNQFSFNHRFSEKLKITTLFRSVHYTTDQVDLSPGGLSNQIVDDTLTMRNGYFTEKNTFNYQSSSFITYNFDMGKVKNTLVGGFDYNQSGRMYENVGTNEFKLSVKNPNFSANDPVKARQNIEWANVLYQGGAKENIRLIGFYAQDQITFSEKWKAQIGFRYEAHQYKVEYFDSQTKLKNGGDTIPNNDKFLPRFGLVFQPTQQISVYGSYSQGFQPQYSSNRAASRDGKPFPPEGSRQWEIGAKGEFLEGKLLTSVALYHIRKTNVLIPDLTDTNGVLQLVTDKVISKGIEFSVQGNLTDNLSVLANYAYNEAKADINTFGFDGFNAGWFQNAPNHSGNIWVNYKILRGNLKGLNFGIGGQHIGKRATFVPEFEIPAYTIADAALGYRIKGLSVNLNLYNLGNVRYYYGSYGPSNLWVGNLRSARISVSYNF
jgi:iron complex outermembrane recepter protein